VKRVPAVLATAEGGGALERRRDPCPEVPSGGLPPLRRGGMDMVREGWLLFVAALLLALIVVVTVRG
jgi:hypothetical protein